MIERPTHHSSDCNRHGNLNCGTIHNSTLRWKKAIKGVREKFSSSDDDDLSILSRGLDFGGRDKQIAGPPVAPAGPAFHGITLPEDVEKLV